MSAVGQREIEIFRSDLQIARRERFRGVQRDAIQVVDGRQPFFVRNRPLAIGSRIAGSLDVEPPGCGARPRSVVGERVDDEPVAVARQRAGEPLPIHRSSEYASVIINSMETGTPSVIYGNVRNTGLIANLPQDACVEVPCLVDRAGVQATAVPGYPPQLAALNRTFLNSVELTVRAVLEERPDFVRHAAMLDPNTAATLTLDEIDALCDDLTRAHGDLLPEKLRALEAVAS